MYYETPKYNADKEELVDDSNDPKEGDGPGE